MQTILQNIVWLIFQKTKGICYNWRHLCVKDSAYYAQKAQELAESEKSFVTTVSRDMERYWSSGDDDEVITGICMCQMSRQIIECDEGYWLSGSEDEDDVGEPKYCYMATSDPPGRSIIQ